MSLNGGAEVPRLYAAQLRDAQAFIRTPLFMHAAHNGKHDNSVALPWRRLARHHPRRMEARQPVVAGGVTKAQREQGDVDGPHLLAAMVVASSSHKTPGYRW